MRKVLLIAFLVCALSVVADAQFNSGSTGADGALDLSTMTCPNNICEVQLPESGILNYTTVNIPQGKALRFRVNTRNTSVTMLAQGTVTISGEINVSPIYQRFGGNCGGPFIALGPGGFRGSGVGSGFGPGGGTPSQPNGRWVGPLSLVPLVGGSGPYGGGYGGGAIVIASSLSITMSGSIGAVGEADNYCNGPYGSGGAIRLVANSANISGSFNACGFGVGINCGVVRIEATQRSFTGTSQPAAVLSTINPTIIPTVQPSLTIASIGGHTVPSYSGTRLDTVDLLLPNQIPDPVNVVVSANNIPVGTEVRVGFVSGSSSGTSTPCNLTGTFASSQCTATISNLNRTGVTYLLATATFTPPAQLAQYHPKGANQIAKIRLESVLGKQPKYVFLRSDKSVIETAKVPKEFLQYFGM